MRISLASRMPIFTAALGALTLAAAPARAAVVCKAQIQVVIYGQATAQNKPGFMTPDQLKRKAIRVWSARVMKVDGRIYARFSNAQQPSWNIEEALGHLTGTLAATPCRP